MAIDEHRETARSVTWGNETGRAWHEQAFEDPAQEHLLAEIRAQAVGFAVLSGIGSPRVELRRVALSHEWVGDGLARMLLRALLERAYGQHAAQQVWLHVRSTDEHVLEFYGQEGFVPADERPAVHLSPDGSTATLLALTHRR